jgi:polysaccharide deacetylase family protein (PEP-CTERM system associated)
MNILTFDIEEWFHILDNKSTKTESEWRNYEPRIHENMDRILQLLQEKKQHATFFCLGWIAEKYPEVIKKIDAEGHEIGTHSHLHQLVYEQSPERFRQDLKRSIETLQSITGKKIRAYRSPGFSLKEDCFWALNILVEEGIETDCSIFPTARAHGGVANFSYSKPFTIKTDGGLIKELPMNYYSFVGRKFIFSGGGYFRLLPYTMLKKMFKDVDYVMTYFHPRDFDFNQPVIKELSVVRKFKSYYGLSRSFAKFNSLINDFSFESIETASTKIDWINCPTYKLSGNGSKQNAFSLTKEK